MKIFRFCLLLALSYPLLSFSQSYSNIDFAAQISKKSIKEKVEVLCSDKMRGREAGTRGQKLAANYIYNQFKTSELESLDRTSDSLSFFQSFNLSKLRLPSGKIQIDGKSFYNYKDFIADPVQDFISIDLELIFIVNSPIENYSEIDFTNKAVLFLTPNFHKAFFKAHKVWKHSKPKLILFADPINHHLFNRYLNIKKRIRNKQFRLNKTSTDSIEHSDQSEFYKYVNDKQIIPISTRLTKAITGLSSKKLRRLALNKDKKVTSKANLSYELIKGEDVIKTENVLALIEGAEKPDEYIVISAHYDHLGAYKNHVYHGANDNASGTAALIEIAKAFKHAELKGQRPKRSVIFAAFTAEEKGLLGSKYFVRNSPVPLKSIKANLNMDMLGRMDDHHTSTNYIYLLGASHLNPQLKQISDSLNKLHSNLILDYNYDQVNNPLYQASDQASFVKNKIPSIMYFNGLHQDYHTVEDTADKLNYENIKRVTQLVFLTAWEIANQ